MAKPKKKCTVAESERILGVKSVDIQNRHMDEQPEQIKRTYTPAEVGYILGLSRASVYAAVKRGELPFFRIGYRILFPKEAIDSKVAG